MAAPSTQSETGNTGQRLIPWLQDRLDSEDIPGLRWVDKEKKIWQLPWKSHKQTKWGDPDAFLLREMAVFMYNFDGDEPGKGELTKWKERLRNNLRSLNGVEEVKDLHENNGDSPYKVYKFTGVITKRRKGGRREQGARGDASWSRSPVTEHNLQTVGTAQSQVNPDPLPRFDRIVSQSETIPAHFRHDASQAGTVLSSHSPDGENYMYLQQCTSQSSASCSTEHVYSPEMSPASATSHGCSRRSSDVNNHLHTGSSEESQTDVLLDLDNWLLELESSVQIPLKQARTVLSQPEPDGRNTFFQPPASHIRMNDCNDSNFQVQNDVSNVLSPLQVVNTTESQVDPTIFEPARLQATPGNWQSQIHQTEPAKSQQIPFGMNIVPQQPTPQSNVNGCPDIIMDGLDSEMGNFSISDDYLKDGNIVSFRSRSPINCAGVRDLNSGTPDSTSSTACAPMHAEVPLPNDSFDSYPQTSAVSENVPVQIIVYYFQSRVMTREIAQNTFRICFVADEEDRETIMTFQNQAQCGPCDAVLVELPLTSSEPCSKLNPREARNINKVLENMTGGVIIEYIDGDIFATRFSRAVPFFRSYDEKTFTKMERNQRVKIFDFNRISKLPLDQQNSILYTADSFSRLTFSLKDPEKYSNQVLIVDIYHTECVRKKTYAAVGGQRSLEPDCSHSNSFDQKLSIVRDLKKACSEKNVL